MSLGEKITSPFRKAARFLEDVVAELKRVVWPSREEAQSFTAVVLIAVGIVAVWVGSLDALCSTIVSALKLYTK